MKQLLFFITFLFAKAAFCQTTFVVDHFSPDYLGKVFIADTTQVFSEGWVAIFSKKSGEQIIKIDAEELTFELHEGKVLANIRELPYGEQSQILYEDYNFDSVKDFAIMDGQNSCYHGPSFQVYLATGRGFVHSPEFTRLSQEYCGMFAVDPDSKTIQTMTKSGCCWHQFSEFRVKDNKPYATKIIEVGMGESGITTDYEEQHLVDGKMVKSKYQVLAVEIGNDNLLLSFEFFNKKRMQIFVIEDRLHYAFTDADGKIELLHNDTFQYSASQNLLTFTRQGTQYLIHDDKIIAQTPSRRYNMKAVNDTRLGTLAKLKTLKLENLVK